MARTPDFVELNRLRSLALDPAAQDDYALELLATTKHREALMGALKVLGKRPSLAARPALAGRYETLAADPNRRDQGGHLRTAIIQALAPVSEPRDLPLIERALFTYEVLPTSPEDVTGPLRAAALVALVDLDRDLARFHGTRLLFDRRAAAMSGEPAVTAARLLVALASPLPLYGYVGGGGGHPDVAAECLRGLTELPGSLLPDLVDRWFASEQEIALLGLVDLLLGHPDGPAEGPALRRWLDATPLLDAYHYAVAAVVARRGSPLLAVLLAHAAATGDEAKRALLLRSLALLESDPAVRAVTERLRGGAGPPRGRGAGGRSGG